MIKLHLASRLILMGNASYKLNIKEISEQVFIILESEKDTTLMLHRSIMQQSDFPAQDMKNCQCSMCRHLLFTGNPTVHSIEHGKNVLQ